MENAAEAGVDDCIHFRVLDISGIAAAEEGGVIIVNPPYGERIGEEKEIENLIKGMIDESLNDNHKRASFGKQKKGNSLFNDLYVEEY